MAERDALVTELREFVRDQIDPLYHFCYFMLPQPNLVEGIVVSTFRELGRLFRKKAKPAGMVLGTFEARILLFQAAWKKVREELSSCSFDGPSWNATLAQSTSDLLEGQGKENWKEVSERLARIDPDFRAPLVLRDVLKFEEEESSQILEVD